MKKVILMIVLLMIGISINAQSRVVKATKLATRLSIDEGKNWEEWSDWTICSILVEIDVDNNMIAIDSKKLQVYKLSDESETLDDNGSFRVLATDLNDSLCWVYFFFGIME